MPSRVAYDSLVREFGEGEFGPLVLAIETEDGVTDPDNIALLYDYSRRIARDPVSRAWTASWTSMPGWASSSTSSSSAIRPDPPTGSSPTALARPPTAT